MTSLEIAIIVAIVLVIAVAVGWWLYTTFISSTGSQARLQIVSVDLYEDGGGKAIITNPGPANVKIAGVYIQGPNGETVATINCAGATDNTLVVGQQYSCTISGGPTGLVPGTMVPGRIVTSGGQSFPFNAIVRPGNTPP
jgi:FlaG/FlaF family flagellin (archaellin)